MGPGNEVSEPMCACGLAVFPGSPGMQISITGIHTCTTSMFAFWSVGAWEQGYMCLRSISHSGEEAFEALACDKSLGMKLQGVVTSTGNIEMTP